MSIKDGGPVYPVRYGSHGITLRAYLAGQALANRNIDEHAGADWANRVAEQAVRIADALIDELGKEPA